MPFEFSRIATSIRFVIAMMRLYAGFESDAGRAVLDILRKQYPGQEITETAGSIGAKLMAIARRQLQGNDTDSMDAIQNFLAYIATGSANETDERGVVKRDDNGDPITRSTGKPWDFAKDFANWNDALKAIFNNLRTTAMSGSMGKSRRKKNERSVDDAFGTRDEDGGAKGNGEGRMPTPDDVELGKALDDRAALGEFYKVIEDYLPDLRGTLSEDELKLFNFIFEDEGGVGEGGKDLSGTFGSDVKENMGQATAFGEKHPELKKKNEKRWSGFVGDLRKKILAKIQEFVEKNMTPGDVDVLYDTFHADVDPSAVRKMEKDKAKGKDDYQRGIDERKVARLKAKADAGGLSADDEKELARLSKKLEGIGVDVEAIKPDANAGAGKKKPKSDAKATQSASVLVMASNVASRRVSRRSGFGV